MQTIPTKKTKIVATIGPASQKKSVLVDMIHAGLNVARMNFSHGTHDDHLNTLKLVQSAALKSRQPVAILQDLSGPKIRIGEVEKGTEIVRGQKFTLTTQKCVGNSSQAFVNYKKLPSEISKGETIKINDGKLELQANRITEDRIYCTVIVGGPLSSRKGVNFPDTQLSISSLTAKDRRDVLFGIKHSVDFIALSFVQTASDVKTLRRILDKHKSQAHIIAKIETTAAVENIDSIIEAADGIMVARGDMAVEVGAQHVPFIQKMIIHKCNDAGKPVITATQMLDSMESSPVPTRAEVSDIANAIIDGTDAIMLSGETTIGDYPVESVTTMTDIALETEPYMKNVDLEYFGESLDVVDTMAASVVRIANNVRARLIINLTESGLTPRMIARFKPHHSIIAVTPHQKTFNQLQLVYGCQPIMSRMSGSVRELTKSVQKLVKKHNLAQKDEKIVISAGSRFGTVGSTNLIFVIEAK